MQAMIHLAIRPHQGYNYSLVKQFMFSSEGLRLGNASIYLSLSELRGAVR